MSDSRRGLRWSGARRSWIAGRQSGIAELRDLADRADELRPARALCFDDGAARGRDAVVAAAPLAGLLDPAAADPAAAFHAVEERVEGGHLELHHAIGAGLDQLAQFVAVAGLVAEQGENQELGASLLDLGWQHAGIYMIHIYGMQGTAGWFAGGGRIRRGRRGDGLPWRVAGERIKAWVAR